VKIIAQIEKGLLVSPRTGKKLALNREGTSLCTADGTETYPMIGEGEQVVPILLFDARWAEEYSKSSRQMTKEYAPENRRDSVVMRLKEHVSKDFRSRVVIASFSETFDPLSIDEALVLSVGGGPKRVHPAFTNLNIGPFPNVDIVADAHVLPYRDACVDAIFCEAVIEHLSQPEQAVGEFYRVLRKGGKVFSIVPFMQAYHGYPNHYQNFTLTGHRLLYEKKGFRVIDSGTCVGPIYTAIHLSSQFAQEYLPQIVSIPLRIVIHAAGMLLKPLDYRLHDKPNSYIFASTTYVIAQT
jgi:SAM-dependent methyltransferase